VDILWFVANGGKVKRKQIQFLGLPNLTIHAGGLEELVVGVVEKVPCKNGKSDSFRPPGEPAIQLRALRGV
jgi:hypothetical protein